MFSVTKKKSTVTFNERIVERICEYITEEILLLIIEALGVVADPSGISLMVFIMFRLARLCRKI